MFTRGYLGAMKHLQVIKKKFQSRSCKSIINWFYDLEKFKVRWKYKQDGIWCSILFKLRQNIIATMYQTTKLYWVKKKKRQNKCDIITSGKNNF